MNYLESQRKRLRHIRQRLESDDDSTFTAYQAFTILSQAAIIVLILLVIGYFVVWPNERQERMDRYGREHGIPVESRR